MERDYYAILGVPKTASPEAIQEAFRRLARTYHPDVSGADTASRFREIQEAWDVLGDTRQRRAYDDRTRCPPPRPLSPHRYTRPDRARRPFSWEMGFPKLGDALHLELHMSRAEAAAGGEIAVALPAVGPCPQCGGLGRRIWSVCSVCQGMGSCAQMERFTLHVPAGLGHGAVVSLPLEEFQLWHSQLIIHVWIVN